MRNRGGCCASLMMVLRTHLVNMDPDCYPEAKWPVDLVGPPRDAVLPSHVLTSSLVRRMLRRVLIADYAISHVSQLIRSTCGQGRCGWRPCAACALAAGWILCGETQNAHMF